MTSKAGVPDAPMPFRWHFSPPLHKAVVHAVIFVQSDQLRKFLRRQSDNLCRQIRPDRFRSINHKTAPAPKVWNKTDQGQSAPIRSAHSSATAPAILAELIAPLAFE